MKQSTNLILISELDGATLDAAIAIYVFNKKPIIKQEQVYLSADSCEPFSPSSTLSQAQPIMDKFKIEIRPFYEEWTGRISIDLENGCEIINEYGDTQLKAAMRAAIRACVVGLFIPAFELVQ